jgi:hypothetical protein
MATFDEDCSRPATLRERAADWWERMRAGRESRLCLCGWHRYGPWRTRPVTGFNIAWQLVAGTEHYRVCTRPRCGRVDHSARANAPDA